MDVWKFLFRGCMYGIGRIKSLVVHGSRGFFEITKEGMKSRETDGKRARS